MKFTFTVATIVALTSGAGTALARDYVLSTSWQPAFCDSHGNKDECANPSPTGFSAANFTLHGLWPQGSDYCGVSGADRATDKSGKWLRLDALALTDRTRKALDEKMPGSQSGLDRHEWFRHGSCSGTNAEDYFTAALALLDSVNQGKLRSLVAHVVGGSVPLDMLRNTVVSEYGEVGRRSVRFICETKGRGKDKRQQLVEIRYALRVGRDLPTTVSAANLRETRERDSCRPGDVYIDKIGR